MPKQALRDAAAQLKRALDSAEDLDLSDREQLVKIHDDIEELLELSAEARPNDHAKVQVLLPGAVGRFEERFPRLSHALGTLADTLTSLGI